MFIVSWCLLIYITHTTDQDHYLLFSRCWIICFDTFNWPRATAGSLTSPPWMSERWVWLSCLPSYDDCTTMIAWWLHLLTRCSFQYFIVLSSFLWWLHLFTRWSLREPTVSLWPRLSRSVSVCPGWRRPASRWCCWWRCWRHCWSWTSWSGRLVPTDEEPVEANSDSG